MLSEVVAFVSVIIAVIALVLTMWQNVLTRRAVQSQLLLTLKQLAKEANYYDGIAAIGALKSYDTYEAYREAEPTEIQKAIYNTVDFLDFVVHLVEDRLLSRQAAWDHYFPGYRICNEKLLPWWLAGIRQDHFQSFRDFEIMCMLVGSISDEAIAKFDAKCKRKLQKL